MNNIKWTFKTFLLSISLSIMFSVISQSMFPHLSIFFSIFIIIFFVVLSTIFDAIGVAVTSTDEEKMNSYKNQTGFETGLKLVKNTEKVASFCGDVIGDICGILSGAGGVSLVLNMNITDQNIYFIVTCLISSLIAGLTIFCKALMKCYAVANAEKVVLKTALILEFSPRVWLKKHKNSKSKKINKK